MSSWAKSASGGRRSSGNPNGSAKTLRMYRRAGPYSSREERGDDIKAALDSYEELEQMQNISGSVNFEGYMHPPNAPVKSEGPTPAERRKTLYQRFYRQVQEEKRPADCVVVSVTNQCLDYPKSLSQCLQERGLSVEMLYLQAESGLTRALQDVRAEGSRLCILVEQTNIALSSCTVIIFSESLKIHRNMPKEQAMDFVQGEHNRGPVKERPPRDSADIAAHASQLLDDFLEREKIAHHTIPSDMRQLLTLLADGVHLYTDELEAISEYVRSRQDHLQASNCDGERRNTAPSGLGKPPPLLPTPPGPPQLQNASVGLMGDHPPPVPLLSSPGSYPKTKPPPLLSLHRHPCPPLGPPLPRDLMPPHMPFGPPGMLRGPLLHHPPFPPGPRGPYGPRGGPPSLKSSRPPLLITPGPPPPRPNGPRL